MVRFEPAAMVLGVAMPTMRAEAMPTKARAVEMLDDRISLDSWGERP